MAYRRFVSGIDSNLKMSGEMSLICRESVNVLELL